MTAPMDTVKYSLESTSNKKTKKEFAFVRRYLEEICVHNTYTTLPSKLRVVVFVFRA